MNDHRDTWSAPSGGWPTFDENGKRVDDADYDEYIVATEEAERKYEEWASKPCAER